MIEPAGLSFGEYLDACRSAVDAALDEWLPRESDCSPPLAASMRYAVFPGGKRLRAVLTLLAAEACGGTQQAAMPAACAVELVHCYSLVHDDLPAMDDDDLRRGRPSCHKAFGEALGILAGDALLTLAFEILARHSATPDQVAASCRELAEAAGACGMVGGQSDDLAAERQADSMPEDAALEMLQSIHARKTGALLRASVRLGCVAAKAHPDQLAALDAYGRAVGVAFQITDDLLDVCGQESRAGKRVQKDTQRGKLTYPRLIGIENSRKMALELCRQACQYLDSLGDRADRLKQLALELVERDN